MAAPAALADFRELLLDLVRGSPLHALHDRLTDTPGGSARTGGQTTYITPGLPWENGCIESFNARLRDELLNGEIFHLLKEARIIIEQ